MKKLITLTMSLMLTVLFVQSCNLNQIEDLREKPCYESSVDKSGDNAQVENPPTPDYPKVQDLKVRYEINGDWVIETIGHVTIDDYCGGCYLRINIDSDCWQYVSGSVWYGSNPNNLIPIEGDPTQFQVQISGNNMNPNFPYHHDWWCGDEIFIAVEVEVEYVCDMDICETVIASTTPFFTTDLYAGQHTDIGEIQAFILGDNLVVKYIIDNPNFDLEYVHLDWAIDFDGLHTNGPGNPQIGHFDYQSSASGDLHTITIPLSELQGEDIDCEVPFVMAAHAEVTGGETAWGLGEEFTPGGSWAEYFTLDYPCGGDEEEDCVFSSWADGSGLANLGINRWGYYFAYTLRCGE